jgi:NADPH:quinone reductase-like Zn-dependent oxidoreductase
VKSIQEKQQLIGSCFPKGMKFTSYLNLELMMKAVILKNTGGTENLALEDIAIPTPKSQEVLVKVHAIGINPVDVKTRKGGALYASLKEDAPVILGWDISGTVQSIGSGVTGFKEGDEVFGMVNFPGHGKAYSEYVAAPSEHLALKPGNISHEKAAGASLAALTAWQVLVYEANMKNGQHLLMHAAAGGVGHFAVQIAKYLGVRVTGTASNHNASFLKEIGADSHIDYTQEPFEDKVQELDVVFDPIGGETTVRSLEIIKQGGSLISIVGGVKEPLIKKAEEKNISAKNYLVHSSGNDMEQLAELLKQKIIDPHISHTFPLEKISEAHEQQESGKTRGKIIVLV